jgi:hypothetical protein
VVYAVLAHRAEQRPCEPVPMIADDQQVGVGRCVEQHPCRIAHHDVLADLDSLRLVRERILTAWVSTSQAVAQKSTSIGRVATPWNTGTSHAITASTTLPDDWASVVVV